MGGRWGVLEIDASSFVSNYLIRVPKVLGEDAAKFLEFLFEDHL